MASEHAYMTVPEKIELSNSGDMDMGYTQPPSNHIYNPMKVFKNSHTCAHGTDCGMRFQIPDTITLESSNPPLNGVGASGGGQGGGGEREDPHYFDEVKRTGEVWQQPKAQEEKLIPLRYQKIFNLGNVQSKSFGVILQWNVLYK